MTIEQAFGTAVRRLRLERKLSQDDLALCSDLDRTFVSQIECGKKCPTLVTIFQLAGGLQVSGERLLAEVEAVMAKPGVRRRGKGCTGGAQRPARVFPPIPEECHADKCTEPAGTILLVEDDEDTRDYLTMMLQLAGFRVIPANDGKEAVQRYDAHHPEIGLVIMDVVIPACNGVESANLIHRRFPEAKVIFISGYEPECLKIAPEKLPFFRKPLEPKSFVTTVRTMLGA